MNAEAHAKHQLARITEAGITGKQLAEELGITSSSVSSHFRSRKASEKTLEKYDEAIDKLCGH